MQNTAGCKGLQEARPLGEISLLRIGLKLSDIRAFGTRDVVPCLSHCILGNQTSITYDIITYVAVNKQFASQ